MTASAKVRPTRQSLSTWAEERDIELIFFDPPEHFDHAILGLTTGYGQEPAVLYDQDQVLAALTKEMGADAAEEWFEYNTIGAYVGPATPRFLITPEPE
jgi:hypothetical protein